MVERRAWATRMGGRELAGVRRLSGRCSVHRLITLAVSVLVAVGLLMTLALPAMADGTGPM